MREGYLNLQINKNFSDVLISFVVYLPLIKEIYRRMKFKIELKEIHWKSSLLGKYNPSLLN